MISARWLPVIGILGVSLSATSRAQTAATPAGGTGDIAEVVVRGEKIDRSLQDTPTSVAVTTVERIEEENLLTLQDIYNRTANVSETYGSAGFTLRGIANNGVSGAGNAPLATVYLDGAALPTSILYAAPTDLWDIAQVEILRGPQSTLQGLNTLAGAVILRSRDPGEVWNGRARAYFAEGHERAYSFAAGGPLVGEEIGIRFAAEKRAADRFIRNVTRGEPEDPLDSLNLRGVLKWTPGAIPGFEARLSHTYFDREGGYSFMYTDTTVPDYFDHRTNASDIANTGVVRTHLTNLELSYPLSDALHLGSTTSYNTAAEHTSYDGDYTAANLGGGTQDRDYDTFSQEFRLTFATPRLSGLLGAYYYQRDQAFGNASITNVPTPVDTIAALLQGNGFDAATAGFVAGLYGGALPVIPVDYTSLSNTDVRTYALFGDGRWRMTDRLSLIAGFRRDREVNNTKSTSTSQFVGTYPDPNAFGAPGDPLWLAVTGINEAVGQLVAQAGASTPASRRRFNAFLPKAGLSYDINEGVTGSFVVQRGYRSGGSGENIARAIVVPYDPEYAWNYELSLRSQWLENRLTLNANAFYLDWSEQQVTVNFGLNIYDTHTVNAGRSHLYGAELEAAYQVGRLFDWYASVGHVRTRFDDFQVVLGSTDNLSGLQFAYAPQWTFGAGANLRWGNGFSANVNVNHRSDVYTDVTSVQSLYHVGSRTIANARIGYERTHWGVHLFANNLLDEKYIQYDAIGTGMAVLGAPRVFGAMIEGRF